jgi:hypothetical protein
MEGRRANGRKRMVNGQFNALIRISASRDPIFQQDSLIKVIGKITEFDWVFVQLALNWNGAGVV